jgi:hypothetical protein
MTFHILPNCGASAARETKDSNEFRDGSDKSLLEMMDSIPSGDSIEFNPPKLNIIIKHEENN